MCCFFFFKQKTAYEMRISDWSSDVCSSDLVVLTRAFTSLGHELGLDWAQANAARITSGDPWERLLLAGLARDFQQLRLEFLGRTEGLDPQKLVNDWLIANWAQIDQLKRLVARARRAPTPHAAMLAQIAGQSSEERRAGKECGRK